MELFSYFVKDKTSSLSQVINWKDYNINEFSVYSFRETFYSKASYPSDIHYHDYYELVVFEGGNIDYICENTVFTPQFGDVVLIPPGKLHMSKISADRTFYKRHVFYFFPKLFDFIEGNVLLDFLKNINNGCLFRFCTTQGKENFMALLNEFAIIIKNNTQLDRVLCLSYLIRIFYAINSANFQLASGQDALPNKLLEIKNFIDENFEKINSVSDISTTYFYTREHLSRMFKKYYNSTIMDYVNKKRIIKSQKLLRENGSISEIALAVGFGSLSTFIRVFKKVVSVTPSEYRKIVNNK